MANPLVAIIGVGATGTVLAASLLGQNPETMLVVRRAEQREEIKKNGIGITGEINCHARVKNLLDNVSQVKEQKPDIIFICTKTFHLASVLDSLTGVVGPKTRIVSAHNGLGTEDVVGEVFGAEKALRMSLNFGATLTGLCAAKVNFFNRPNHLGALVSENREIGLRVARLFSEGGLDTEYVEDIKLNVWKKMIMKCTMASICAVTDKTIKEALELPATREIADGCFAEALAVAKAKGYDLGADYMKQALAYLEKVGVHKDSMCVDIANKTQTEIDFLGGKVVEYGREKGIPTPHYMTMANLVRAMEHDYLR
ncbi:MAG: 2-dehydropantoate 2-reductase [Syntrophobacteraceae bacterium]|nr:2-dehydropantoate 2-reductase [Syntrophobacteraceae bacterium]